MYWWDYRYTIISHVPSNIRQPNSPSKLGILGGFIGGKAVT